MTSGLAWMFLAAIVISFYMVRFLWIRYAHLVKPALSDLITISSAGKNKASATINKRMERIGRFVVCYGIVAMLALIGAIAIGMGTVAFAILFLGPFSYALVRLALALSKNARTPK